MVVAVSVPEGLAKDLAGYAEAQGQSKSAVVTEALKGFLARKKR
jgi:predicted transcriptional regulator